MIKKIYLSFQNGGDESVYAELFEDEDVAFMDQTLQEEGWGEPCVQVLEISSDSEISILNDRITSRQEYIEELEDAIHDEYTEPERKNQLANAIKLLTGTL